MFEAFSVSLFRRVAADLRRAAALKTLLSVLLRSAQCATPSRSNDKHNGFRVLLAPDWRNGSGVINDRHVS